MAFNLAISALLKVLLVTVIFTGVRCDSDMYEKPEMESPSSPKMMSPSSPKNFGPPMPAPSPAPMPSIPFPPDCPTGLPFSDVDILNFALNLECLEAEFYSWAAFGKGLPAEYLGGGPGSVGGQKAQLTPDVQDLADEVANDEMKHVLYLRQALGANAVACPLMDIGSSFSKAANLAFNKTLDPPFSPYLNDIFFGLGAYVFEDVGVTAYNGAAPYIMSRAYLQAGASILGTEAYHAGAIRVLLSQIRFAMTPYGVSVGVITNAIAQLRNQLGGIGVVDEGVLDTATGRPIVVDADPNSLVYARLPPTIIKIVSVFYPNGLNGYFK